MDEERANRLAQAKATRERRYKEKRAQLLGQHGTPVIALDYPCRFGCDDRFKCEARAAYLVEFPDGQHAFPDRLQALCEDHALRGVEKNRGQIVATIRSRRARLDRHNALRKERDHPLYRIYGGIKTRCYNERSKSYQHYGARGVVMCDEWLRDFNAFCRDVGPRPSLKHQLGRQDVDGPYAPWNCAWELPREQMRNTRRSRWITIDGETRTLVEWCEMRGVDPDLAWSRLNKGWDPDKAISTADFRPMARSGYRGVRQNGERWDAWMRKAGEQLWLGRFDTPEQAHQAYLDAQA